MQEKAKKEYNQPFFFLMRFVIPCRMKVPMYAKQMKKLPLSGKTSRKPIFTSATSNSWLAEY
jgi:hypothetical protein